MPYNYDNVKNNCKGEVFMRKYYLDNIRWVTVVLVVIYHVLYMYNGEGILGGLGKITALDVQYYDIFCMRSIRGLCFCCSLYREYAPGIIWTVAPQRNLQKAGQENC